MVVPLCRRPVLRPQIRCAACLCCAQQPPVGGDVRARLQHLDLEIADAKLEVEAAAQKWSAAPKEDKAIPERIYNNLAAKEQKLLDERAGLNSQLTAGWSQNAPARVPTPLCAHPPVRPLAPAPTCPCARPHSLVLQPCDTQSGVWPAGADACPSVPLSQPPCPLAFMPPSQRLSASVRIGRAT